MLILKRTGFAAIVLIVCRSGVGIFGSIISPNDSSSVETDDVLHLDQYILLLLPQNKEHLEMAMGETRNCGCKGE